MSHFGTYHFGNPDRVIRTEQIRTISNVNAIINTKRTFKMTLGFFFSVIIVIIITSNSNTCYGNSYYIGYNNENIGIIGIISSFCSNFSIICSNNRYLGENVDLLDTCKKVQKWTLVQLLPLLTPLTTVKIINIIPHPIIRILLIKLV